MTQAYSIIARDEVTLERSSSGGLMTAITDYYLDNGCAVICSVYDYSQQIPLFRYIENKDERNEARGSVYIQSDMMSAFKILETWRNESTKEIVFIGTGCQVAAVDVWARNKNIRNKITLVDLICSGVPSPQLWKKYISSLEEKYGKTVRVCFKDKRNGWKNPFAYIQFEKGIYSLDPYVTCYNDKLCLREACYYCPYTTVERISDLTIGDYWGVEKHYPDIESKMGVSLCLSHSSIGEKIVNEISNVVLCKKIEIENALQPRLISPPIINKERNAFFYTYKTKGALKAINDYGVYSISKKIKNHLKAILK